MAVQTHVTEARNLNATVKNESLNFFFITLINELICIITDKCLQLSMCLLITLLFLTNEWPSVVFVNWQWQQTSESQFSQQWSQRHACHYSHDLRSTNYLFCMLGNVVLWLEMLWKDWPAEAMLSVCIIWLANPICWASTEHRTSHVTTQKTVRNKEEETFS